MKKRDLEQQIRGTRDNPLDSVDRSRYDAFEVICTESDEYGPYWAARVEENGTRYVVGNYYCILPLEGNPLTKSPGWLSEWWSVSPGSVVVACGALAATFAMVLLWWISHNGWHKIGAFITWLLIMIVLITVGRAIDQIKYASQ